MEEPANYYAPQLRKLELDDLREALSTGLRDEIAMMRVAIRRMLEIANGAIDPDKALKALSALSLAATRLAHLLKIEAELTGGNSSKAVAQAIQEAVAEIAEELIQCP